MAITLQPLKPEQIKWNKGIPTGCKAAKLNLTGAYRTIFTNIQVGDVVRIRQSEGRLVPAAARATKDSFWVQVVGVERGHRGWVQIRCAGDRTLPQAHPQTAVTRKERPAETESRLAIDAAARQASVEANTSVVIAFDEADISNGQRFHQADTSSVFVVGMVKSGMVRLTNEAVGAGGLLVLTAEFAAMVRSGRYTQVTEVTPIDATPEEALALLRDVAAQADAQREYVTWADDRTHAVWHLCDQEDQPVAEGEHLDPEGTRFSISATPEVVTREGTGGYAEPAAVCIAWLGADSSDDMVGWTRSEYLGQGWHWTPEI